MPYTFGVAGGSVITDFQGNILKCASGDGRTAVCQEYGLNLCLFCRNNVKLQEGKVGAGGIGQSNNALAFIITNKNTNLRGT